MVFRRRKLPVKAFSISTTTSANSSVTKDAECSGSESENIDKKKPLKQDVIKIFFNIIRKKRKRGRPPNPKKLELSPNKNEQKLDPPARKKRKIENVYWNTDMNWPFLKGALTF